MNNLYVFDDEIKMFVFRGRLELLVLFVIFSSDDSLEVEYGIFG